VKAYTQPPANISVSGAMSVKMENQSGDQFIFSDIAPFNLYVLNALSVDIVISADKYIETVDGLTELAVGQRQEATNAKIFTRRPQFTIKAGNYPSLPNYDFKIEGNTMYVVVGQKQ
jgi:hypothetical protein